MYNVADLEAYIRQAAQARGIDPNIAVKVAKSEGLAPGVWQSNYHNNGRRETSYGPFQLLVGGGLGDKFQAKYGKSPADPSTVYQQVDFALDNAKQGGWSPWYGAAKVGVDNWSGIGGAPSGPMPTAPTLKASDYPPSSIGGIGSPTAPGQNQPSVFGSMAPSQPTPMPDAVARDIAGRLGVDENGLNPMEKAGKYFSDAFDVPQAPAVWPRGDARQTGDALLKQLRDPRALAKMFLSQRLSA